MFIFGETNVLPKSLEIIPQRQLQWALAVMLIVPKKKKKRDVFIALQGLKIYLLPSLSPVHNSL